MKKTTLIIRQSAISRIFPNGFTLTLDCEASILDAIRMTDKEIKRKCGRFPVEKCKSLFHMVYHPHENRFYRQVAIQAYTSSNQFLNIREDPKMPLPDGATVILIPEGGCATDWEERI